MCHITQRLTVKTFHGIYKASLIANFGNVLILLLGAATSVEPWLLIQNKVTPGTVSFTQTWAAYRDGFGTATLQDNYWIGNNLLHQLTSSAACHLRVEVTQF